MALRRFQPPARDQVGPESLDHPLFAPFQAWHGLLLGPQWPAVASLDAVLAVAGKRFVVQDAALLGDGLHYEARIQRGCIATRQDNWHDLFNALVWARYPALKHALNAAQCRHLAQMGSSARNAAQQALTQFDESGLLLRVSDPALVAAWDAHDWQALFVSHAEAWRDGRIVVVCAFGHALLEQLLLPGRKLVGKCLLVQADDDERALASVLASLDAGQVLQQASELRPLPLAGIPGWYPDQDATFHADAGYFRPLRAGRSYPRPLLADAGAQR